jgi:hypothetical protein
MDNDCYDPKTEHVNEHFRCRNGKHEFVRDYWRRPRGMHGLF